MSEQPEALRLAAVPIFDRSITWQSQATIELRRLYDVLGKSQALNRIREARIKELEAQRPPLTDEEMRALADKYLSYQPESYEASGVLDLVRAVERKVRG